MWSNISNYFKQWTICTLWVFFLLFFLKKILLFHLGNEILSLVVHWGIKVMDMTKKLMIRKLHWQKSQRVSSVDFALVCFQCFQNLFINYKKLKQFARKRTITKNNCWNNNKIMKKIVKCIMYEKNWNWWTSPCVIVNSEVLLLL